MDRIYLQFILYIYFFLFMESFIFFPMSKKLINKFVQFLDIVVSFNFDQNLYEIPIKYNVYIHTINKYTILSKKLIYVSIDLIKILYNNIKNK